MKWDSIAEAGARAGSGQERPCSGSHSDATSPGLCCTGRREQGHLRATQENKKMGLVMDHAGGTGKGQQVSSRSRAQAAG